VSLVTFPQFSDHFPKLRRGHGSRHTRPKFDKDGVKVRNGNPCNHEGCKGGYDAKGAKSHFGQDANIADWKQAVRMA
jgi:hypothetical protein